MLDRPTRLAKKVTVLDRGSRFGFLIQAWKQKTSVLSYRKVEASFEHTDVPESLLNPLSRPGMEQETLHTDPDVVEPIVRPGIGLQAPRRNEEDRGANGQGASTDSCVALLWVIKTNKEILRLVRGD
jgi:hypothetical protein